MSALNNPSMDLLTHALDLTSQRQALVAQNIANVDTPGYHTRDLDFGRELRRALTAGEEYAPQPVVQPVPGLIDRPDGNNVNIDRESLLMAQNQLQFQAEAALLRSEFNRLQMAINGGGGQ